MLAQSRAFFSLPLEAKRAVLANKLNRGYTAFEEEVRGWGGVSCNKVDTRPHTIRNTAIDRPTVCC